MSGPCAVARLDADASVGRGHAVRTAALLDALPGTAPPIVVGRGADDLAALFPGARIEPPARYEALAARADLLVVDHPDPREARVATSGLRVVVDDGGDAACADVVVNGSGPGTRHAYPKLPEEALRLCGPRYALLRPAFAEARGLREPAEVPEVIVVAGSGANAARWLLGLLAEPSGTLHLCVVVGGSFAEPERLRSTCEAGGHELRVDLEAEELARRLCRASVALVTGGMIVPEALTVGVPCVAFPNEPDLVEEIAWLESEGALLGLEPKAEPEAAWARVEEALAQGPPAARPFDGRGCFRVAGAVWERLAGAAT